MLGTREQEETKQRPSPCVANTLAEEMDKKQNVIYSCGDKFMREKQCRLREWRVTESSVLNQVIRGLRKKHLSGVLNEGEEWVMRVSG